MPIGVQEISFTGTTSQGEVPVTHQALQLRGTAEIFYTQV